MNHTHSTHGYPMELLDMYTMDVVSSRHHLSTGAFLCVVAPVVAGVLLLVAAMLPEFSFFAECQNIPGGDICTITVK